jgi:hypothetical protein
VKRNNDVFFLTLIDFLLQVLFFGIVIFALMNVLAQKQKTQRVAEEEKIKQLVKAAGVSNITELTDELTKLAPISELKGTSDYLQKFGSAEDLKKLAEMTHESGGAAALLNELESARKLASSVAQGSHSVADIQQRLEKLRKLEEGQGAAPCLFTMQGDRKRAKAVASVTASDTSIRIDNTEPEFEHILKLVGSTNEAVKELTLAQFAEIFRPLGKLKPECRYTLRFVEKTELVHARDAAQVAFYLSYQRQR